ncbi:MAG: MFS transporter [Actinomycetota bacterium]
MTTAPISPLGAESGPTRLITRQFVILAISTSCFFFGFGSLNVLLPQYVVDELGGSEAAAGLAIGSMAFSAIVTRVWFGRLADRRGARLIMLIGAVLAATATVLTVFTTSLATLIATRLIYGAGQAAFFTGSTTLSIDLAPVHRRSQAASYILVAVHVGAGIGPVIAVGLSDRFSYDTIWLITAGMIALAGVFATFLSYRPPDHLAPPSPLINTDALAPGVVSLLGIFSFNGFLVFAPLYAREVGLSNVGLVFFVASFTVALVRVTLGWVPDRIGPIRAGTIALSITAGGALIAALWPEPEGLFVAAAVLAMGLSLQSPSLIAVTVQAVPANERGSAMATFTGFFDVANAIVGPTIGLIVLGAGYREAFLVATAMAIVGLVVLRLVVAPRWHRHHVAPT